LVLTVGEDLEDELAVPASSSVNDTPSAEAPVSWKLKVMPSVSLTANVPRGVPVLAERQLEGGEDEAEPVLGEPLATEEPEPLVQVVPEDEGLKVEAEPESLGRGVPEEEAEPTPLRRFSTPLPCPERAELEALPEPEVDLSLRLRRHVPGRSAGRPREQDPRSCDWRWCMLFGTEVRSWLSNTWVRRWRFGGIPRDRRGSSSAGTRAGLAREL
jgi:hypothetical protein